jgi:hypothetical protein
MYVYPLSSIIIISSLQSTAGHRPLQFFAISLDPRLLASIYVIIFIDGLCGVVVGNLGYYARGRWFDSHTVQTFVCMNMSVYIGLGV